MLVLRDVVVPVNFESASHDALAYARELAATFGARLHLLHILDDAFALPAGTEGLLSAFPQLARPAEANARERLNELLTENDRVSGAVTIVTISSSPAEAIVGYAQDVQAGAIVMGTRGRRDLPPDSAIGSVAEEVVRRAPCPVMIMPRNPQEALTRAEPDKGTSSSLPPAQMTAGRQ